MHAFRKGENPVQFWDGAFALVAKEIRHRENFFAPVVKQPSRFFPKEEIRVQFLVGVFAYALTMVR